MGVPPIAEALREAGLKELELYIRRRNNMVVQFIAIRPIMDLCLEAERRPGVRVQKWWWYQDGLQL